MTSTPIDHPDFVPPSSRLAPAVAQTGGQAVDPDSAVSFHIDSQLLGDTIGLSADLPQGCAAQLFVPPGGAAVGTSRYVATIGNAITTHLVTLAHFGVGCDVVLFNPTGAPHFIAYRVVTWTGINARQLLPSVLDQPVNVGTVPTSGSSDRIDVRDATMYERALITVTGDAQLDLIVSRAYVVNDNPPLYVEYDETVITAAAAGSTVVDLAIGVHALACTVVNDDVGDLNATYNVRLYSPTAT